MPRRIRFEELISVLVAEHGTMESDLAEIQQATSKKDLASASGILRGLDTLFNEHAEHIGVPWSARA